MTIIWYKDLSHFITKDNYLEFYPLLSMDYNHQLNTIFRLSIYFTLLMILLTNNYKYIYVIIFMGFLTFALANIDNISKKNNKDTFANKNNGECTIPTQDNPFMNFTINEINDNPDKGKACNPLNKNVKHSIQDNFNNGLIRSISDIFEKEASDRQFYTTPNTEIINDQTGLANWLYKTEPTCKEKNMNCSKNLYRVILE